jgi:hypothetical protein
MSVPVTAAKGPIVQTSNIAPCKRHRRPRGSEITASSASLSALERRLWGRSIETRILDKLGVLRICTTEIIETCRSYARLMMKMAIGDCCGVEQWPPAEMGVTQLVDLIKRVIVRAPRRWTGS